MITNFTQRWSIGGRAVYKPVREYFNPRNFSIEAVDEKTAKTFITRYHYSQSLPAARRRFGLFDRGELVGIAVYSHPMSEKVITNVFHCERASDGLELGRLCLTDEVLSNAESFFVAECNRRLRREGFIGVVSFSDDMPRRSIGGSVTHVGHLGIVYQALNAAFLSRSTPSKLFLLPDGTILSARTISKIRAGERGWQYGARLLESFGASPCPENPEERKKWLKQSLAQVTRRINHPGNLRYAWSFSQKVVLNGLPYPKIRFGDLQSEFAF